MTSQTSDADSKHRPLDHGDYSEYLLHAKGEILFTLRALAAAGDRVTVYFNEGRDFLLTVVLAADNDGVVLDYGGDEATNSRAQSAGRLICITSHEKVRVQFVLHGLKVHDFDGRPAFLAPLPESVLRLQRREFFRLATPLINPVKCRIPVAATKETPAATVDATVLDISGGGMALAKPPQSLLLSIGQQYAGCRIDLPEVGVLVATLEIRSIFDVPLRSGAMSTRIGCRFVDLPGQMLTLVQRYIIKVERERKARESGLE